MNANTYYLDLMSVLLSIFQRQKLMNHKGRQLILGKKRQEALKKRLGCKFRINTSDAERGYDTDYEVGKTQAFISKFKDKKIKELEDKIKKLKL